MYLVVVPTCESLLSDPYFPAVLCFSSFMRTLVGTLVGTGREARVIGLLQGSLGDTGAWDLLWVGRPGTGGNLGSPKSSTGPARVTTGPGSRRSGSSFRVGTTSPQLLHRFHTPLEKAFMVHTGETPRNVPQNHKGDKHAIFYIFWTDAQQMTNGHSQPPTYHHHHSPPSSMVSAKCFKSHPRRGDPCTRGLRRSHAGSVGQPRGSLGSSHGSPPFLPPPALSRALSGTSSPLSSVISRPTSSDYIELSPTL